MSRNERSIWLTKQTGNLLGAMIVRDVQGAQDALDQIAEKESVEGVLTACYSAAEITRRTAFPYIKRGDGTLNGQSNGGIMGVSSKAQNAPPGQRWAAQFLAAYINGDDDTAVALFFSNIDKPQEHASGVTALLSMCADVVRDDLTERYL